MTTLRDWIALSLAPGLGVSGFWKLHKYFDGPASVLRAPSAKLRGVPGIRESQIAALCAGEDLLGRSEVELKRLAELGAVAICFDDPLYPLLLKQLTDPPPVLYVHGDKQLLGGVSVAIVGSRAATTYGRRTAQSLARQLATRRVTVVSGLALGIDAEAHQGALDAQGATVGVLGCGIDVVYPQQNRPLYRQIVKSGALVSEYPLGTPPEGFRFPARNRIIAGLSKGIVVVEAAKRSGSLITAQIGLDYGREIFAVPGQVDSSKSEGSHWLLQQGAKLVQRVDDIIAELNIEAVTLPAQETTLPGEVELEPDAVLLLSQLEPYPHEKDLVIARVGLSPARVSELLLYLELEGLIEVLPGNRVRKVA